MRKQSNLSQLGAAFKSKSISKLEYIGMTSLIHDPLYDYSEILAGNENNEIRKRNGF